MQLPQAWISRDASRSPLGPLSAGAVQAANRFCKAAACFAVAVGCIVLIGWIVDSPALKGAVGVPITMKANTAICLELIGASLWLLSGDDPRLFGFGRLLAGLVAIVAGLTLSQHLTGWSLGIDQWLFTEPPGEPATASPGRMGLPASLSFVLIGTSLCAVDRPVRKGRIHRRYLSLMAALIMLFSIVGYAFGSPEFYSTFRVTGIAWPTAVTLFVLSLGALAVRPDNIILQILCASNVGGLVFRRLLIPSIAIPFVLLMSYGAVRDSGWIDASAGRVILAVIMMIALTGIALLTAHRLCVTAERESTAERRLRHSEEELADFFESAVIGMHWLSQEGIIVRANKADLDLLGYSREEYIGRHVSEFHLDKDSIVAVLKGLRIGQVVREFPARLKSKDGKVKDVLIDLGGRRDEQQSACIRCFTRDVTEKRQAEVLGQRLSAIVESSNDAIISKDLRGIVTSWNRGAERMFGYTAEEMIGQPITLLIPADRIDEETQILQSIRRGERVEVYEAVRRRKDGRLIDVSLSISPLLDAGGQVIGASKIARDVSERKTIEAEREALLESERAARGEAERATRMRDEFLAVVSHELRTPLNGVLGWSQYLKRGLAGDKSLLEGVEAIERGARAQAQLIDDLLDMNRITTGKLALEIAAVPLANVIESAISTIRPAAEAKGIHVRMLIEKTVSSVVGDPARLQQVAWNLLSNAVKFTPKGGRIDVILRTVDSQVEIAVTDTGIGISPEFLPHVFERFRQADSSTTRMHGGLGIGLSIVKHLVELHGGTVLAESQGEGTGATFIVRLPMSAVHEQRLPASPAPVSSAEASKIDLTSVKILVVDDDQEARELIKRILTQCQAEVRTAGSGVEALAMLESEKPDVLVSDIGMPNMDGYQFMRKVRQLPHLDAGTVPAIALTAYARSDDRTRAMLAGYQMHISKPVEPQELLATIASFTGRTSASRE